jgi:stage II sporulation protein D
MARRKWLFALVMAVVVGSSCMPYVRKPRRENLVRVAVECGVDRVDVGGVRSGEYHDNYRLSVNETFPQHLGPKNGVVVINGRKYRGSTEIRKIDGNLWVINVVDLEEYLKGVVPCEIGGLSEKQYEAAKAQAVAARTYALAHLNQYAELGFDLYATVQDQVYRGVVCEREMTNKAIESTAGEVLFYRNEPIEAKYHSTCGGRTADFNDAWSGNPPAYLRSVRCRYCEKSPYYEWNKEMLKKEFYAHIRNRLRRININFDKGELIKSFKLSRNRRSKRVREIVIVTNRDEYKIPMYRIRTLLGRPGDPGGLLKSNYFNIKTRRDNVIIEGRGFGHGVGMCQYGAIEMANRGKNYRQILYHYYRGTRIKKIR